VGRKCVDEAGGGLSAGSSFGAGSYGAAAGGGGYGGSQSYGGGGGAYQQLRAPPEGSGTPGLHMLPAALQQRARDMVARHAPHLQESHFDQVGGIAHLRRVQGCWLLRFGGHGGCKATLFPAPSLLPRPTAGCGDAADECGGGDGDADHGGAGRQRPVRWGDAWAGGGGGAAGRAQRMRASACLGGGCHRPGGCSCRRPPPPPRLPPHPAGVRNLPAYLMGIIKRYQRGGPAPGTVRNLPPAAAAAAAAQAMVAQHQAQVEQGAGHVLAQ